MQSACSREVPTQVEEALHPVEADELVAEVATYLAAVAAFREEGCEPRWRLEDRPIPARV